MLAVARRRALFLLAGCFLGLGLAAETRADSLTWGPVVTRTAEDCDAFTPVRAPDGHHYTSFGDCSGLNSNGRKMSMGFGRLIGGPGSLTVQDLPTPDLTDYGDRAAGQKPSSAIVIGARMYMWIRNVGPNGTQARLKFSDSFMRVGSRWSWAPFTLESFGYPVFVQNAPGPYTYIVAHDNNSAYKPAARFILMRVPSTRLLDKTAYEYFSGTPSRPSWSSSLAARAAIFSSPGRCYRSGMSYSRARGRYYWWQGNGDSRVNDSFSVWAGPNPWGPWEQVYHTKRWDIDPGERGEFPPAWMGSEPISKPGTLHLLFSGSDRLTVRRATIAAGH